MAMPSHAAAPPPPAHGRIQHRPPLKTRSQSGSLNVSASVDVWLERELIASRAENAELKRSKQEADARVEELTRHAALLDRMRVAAVCRQALVETRHKKSSPLYARLETQAVDRVLSECGQELERFKAWRKQACPGSKGSVACRMCGAAVRCLCTTSPNQQSSHPEGSAGAEPPETFRQQVAAMEAEVRTLRQEAQSAAEARKAGAEEVAQLQAQLTALRGERDQHAHASALMQAEIRRLMEDSDHAVSSMLERMQALPEVGAADLASMAHHIDTSLSTFMVLDRKVEALRRDVTVSDTPEAAPFGSNAMRAHEPGLLLRLQRHASAIGSQMGALGANLEAADAKLRWVQDKVAHRTSRMAAPDSPQSGSQRRLGAPPPFPDLDLPMSSLSSPTSAGLPSPIPPASEGACWSGCSSPSLGPPGSPVWRTQPVPTPGAGHAEAPSTPPTGPPPPGQRSPSPASSPESWAATVASLRQHLARLDGLLDGNQDQQADAELQRLRANLAAMFADTDSAALDMDEVKRCLSGMLGSLVQSQPALRPFIPGDLLGLR